MVARQNELLIHFFSTVKLSWQQNSWKFINRSLSKTFLMPSLWTNTTALDCSLQGLINLGTSSQFAFYPVRQCCVLTTKSTKDNLTILQKHKVAKTLFSKPKVLPSTRSCQVKTAASADHPGGSHETEAHCASEGNLTVRPILDCI